MLRSKSKESVFLATLMLILIISMSGCGNKQTPTEVATISDYVPFNQNVKMVYEGQGNEFASYTTYVDYINNDKIQIRTNNGGTEFVSVFQNLNGALTQIYVANEMYYKEDLTVENPNMSEVLLQEPLKKGTKWTLSDGRQREITDVAVSVETPYGSFEALEVTTTKDGQLQQKQYYAPDIGPIKTVSTVEADEISSSLKELITGGGFDFTVRSYNFFVTDTDIESNFVDKTVTLKTGQNINDFMASEFLEGGLMSENTVLNEVWIKPASEVANIDFSSQFVTEMNAGTTKETGVLMSVANTVGNYFQVQKVIITLDGEPYSSGHILMKEGEAFNTTYQNGAAD